MKIISINIEIMSIMKSIENSILFIEKLCKLLSKAISKNKKVLKNRKKATILNIVFSILIFLLWNISFIFIIKFFLLVTRFPTIFLTIINFM